jgi:hypothetical protein
MQSQFSLRSKKMTKKEYFADPRINASTLKLFAGRDFEPLIALHKMKHGMKESQSMALGTGLHEVMEVGIEAKFEAINAAFKTAGPRENAIEKAKAMATSIRQKIPLDILMMIESGEKEKAVFSGEYKAMFDVLCNGVGIDYKTTNADSRSEFERDFFKYNYHIQDFHYRKVGQLNRMIYIVVSTSEPHPVWIYETTTSCQIYGNQEWSEALERYHHYKDQDLSTATAEIIDLLEPAWAFCEEVE